MTIIFDIDGTLTETCGVDTECFFEAIEAIFDFSDIDTNWTEYTHVTDRGILDELSQDQRGIPVSDEEFTRFEQVMAAALEARDSSHFRPISGAVEFFSNLVRSPGHQIALATGACRESALVKLKRAGIDHQSVPLVSSSDAISREEIMLLSASKINGSGIDSQEVIYYLGDGMWDLKACANLGWHFIGIGSNISALAEKGTRHTFADYTEPEALQALFSST